MSHTPFIIIPKATCLLANWERRKQCKATTRIPSPSTLFKENKLTWNKWVRSKFPLLLLSPSLNPFGLNPVSGIPLDFHPPTWLADISWVSFASLRNGERRKHNAPSIETVASICVFAPGKIQMGNHCLSVFKGESSLPC